MSATVPVEAVGSAFARGCTLPPPSEAMRAAWHGGRRRYAVWLIEADTPEVGMLAAAARARLARWLGPAPRRQPHITLCACGFAARSTRLSDDFDTLQRQAQRAGLARAEPSGFSLTVGGIGSFNGCAYLRVADTEGRLRALHRLLAGAIPQARAQRFVPHVTLGFYRERFALDAIARAAEGFEGAVRLPVTALTLATYDPRAPDTALRYWWRLPLG